MNSVESPIIIQGGMGAGVSSWQLARAVARAGHLGVVSGTALDVILARRLQVGDIGGHVRRALKNFPVPDVAKRIIDRYFVPGGKSDDKSFRAKPVPAVKPSRHLEDLLVASNFVEVFLAKEGHDNPVGINYLEKIQVPNLPSIYGAMLAGVTYILMGAGIPRTIPGILDRLAQRQEVELRLDVKGADPGEEFFTRFDPNEYCGGAAPMVERPRFIAIVASATLANMLARKSNGSVDGFIVEGPTAGGHNAPPRGQLQLSVEGEPIYSERDIVDLEAMKALGRPFWLAGGYGTPQGVVEALRMGATGVQVGTAFAYTNESGIDPAIKKRVIAMSRAGEARVFTDPIASPTGFPFKVVQLPGTISEESAYQARTRVCDLSYLRHAYKKPDGTVGWRCPSEPVEDYVKKGGDIKDTVGRKCVCNGLLVDIGLGQIQRNGEVEKALVTSGDDVATVARFLKPGATSYAASDVLEYLTSELDTALSRSAPVVSRRAI